MPTHTDVLSNTEITNPHRVDARRINAFQHSVESIEMLLNHKQRLNKNEDLLLVIIGSAFFLIYARFFINNLIPQEFLDRSQAWQPGSNFHDFPERYILSIFCAMAGVNDSAEGYLYYFSTIIMLIYRLLALTPDEGLNEKKTILENLSSKRIEESLAHPNPSQFLETELYAKNIHHQLRAYVLAKENLNNRLRPLQHAGLSCILGYILGPIGSRVGLALGAGIEFHENEDLKNLFKKRIL
jgi:hypothetical protein